MIYGIGPPLFDDELFERKRWFMGVFEYVRSRTKVFTVTADYTVASDVFDVRVDCTAGACTVTLPTANSWIGRQLTVKKIDASANAVTVTRSGTDLIDGATTKSLATQYTRVGLIAGAPLAWDVLF